MSNFNLKRLEEERHIERQYYANTLRVNMLALVQMTEGKYPWDNEEWLNAYPDLGRFLQEADSEYGSAEEDYLKILSQYHALSKIEKWLLESYHKSLKKHNDKYVLPMPVNLKSSLPYIVTFIIGIAIGWLLF